MMEALDESLASLDKDKQLESRGGAPHGQDYCSCAKVLLFMTTPLAFSIMGLAKDIPYFIFSLICGILGVAGPPTVSLSMI